MTTDKQYEILSRKELRQFYHKDLICTPFSLIEEIIEKLPKELFDNPNTKFLDPAMGRGAFLLVIKNKLLLAGHSEQHIVENMLYGVDIYQENVNFSIEILTGNKYKHNLMQGDSLQTQTNSLDLNKNNQLWGGMKFDVVVGNPPYQDSENKNSQTLWPKFIDLAFNFCKEHGLVALITPRTWATNKLYNTYFLKKSPLFINLDECVKYFPGVNSSFSYYIIENSNKRNWPIKIHSQYGLFELEKLPSFGLGNPNPIAISILSKMANVYCKFKVYSSYKYHSDNFSKCNENFSKVITPTHTYPVLFKTTKGVNHFFYANFLDDVQSEDVRVVVNKWVANYKKMFVTDNILTCQQYMHFPVKSLTEGENLKKVLCSNLYYFFCTSLVSSGSFTIGSLSFFPEVNLEKEWTDQELYEHFNLTEEEINLIEKTIKR